MKTFYSIKEFKEWRQSLSAHQKVGFVPTMGNLHEGHCALLREAKKQCDISVLSLFVNPTQFGPQEDFNQYPRTLEEDLKKALAQNCDAVFVPSSSEMYPEGFSTFAEESEVSAPLCGRFRPGHFRGVITVVLKLFNCVQPQKSFFGWKDAQQLLVLQKVVHDLDLDGELVGVEIVREQDGVALSSRNQYLSVSEREKAPVLYQALKRTKERLFSEDQSISSILNEEIKFLKTNQFQVQYFDLLEMPYLKSIDLDKVFRDLNLEKKSTDPRFLLATAVILGKTRLIDNIRF